MKKCRNWEHQLIQYVNGELGKPFAWGERDCSSFAAACLKIIVGDMTLPWNFPYRNERDALRYAREVIPFYDFLKAQDGVVSVAPNYEQRGDFIFGQLGAFDCCHIVLGAKVVGLDMQAGVCLAPLSDFKTLTPYRALRVA